MAGCLPCMLKTCNSKKRGSGDRKALACVHRIAVGFSIVTYWKNCLRTGSSSVHNNSVPASTCACDQSMTQTKQPTALYVRIWTLLNLEALTAS